MYLYLLCLSNKTVGVFDSKYAIDTMIYGLKQNSLYDKNKISIRKFKTNSICEIKDTNDNIKNNNNNNIQNDDNKQISKLSQKEEDEKNKEKCEIEYKLNKLKKNKEKIEDSKKTYKIDIELYKKFKEIKKLDITFIVPELFTEKYRVFEMIENDNNLNWENFYANYVPHNASSSYRDLFNNVDSKTINI